MDMEKLKNGISQNSNFYEQLIEHVFISEILQEVWFKYGIIVEVLRAEIDNSGYDIVLECNGIIRHIQLKTSIMGAAKTSIDAHIGLSDKPSGCIVWIEWSIDDSYRVKLSYLFFGNNPGECLPDIATHKVGKHNKADSTGVKKERPSKRTIKKSEFRTIESMFELINVLFNVN